MLTKYVGMYLFDKFIWQDYRMNGQKNNVGEKCRDKTK